MTKTRMAMMAVALVAGMSTMAVAQGRGGGRGGPRVGYTALLMGATLTGADSAALHPIDSVFTADLQKFRTDNGLAPQRGGGGGGGTAPPVATAEQKATFKPRADQYVKDIRAKLSPANQAILDTNAKTWDPLAPQMGGRRGGGGGGGGGK